MGNQRSNFLRRPRGDNNRTLWVFNDNEQDRLSNKLGAGNAQFRPFNKLGVHSAAPLSAGVTTGSSGVGYASLSPCAERVINADILSIQKLLATGEYSSVKYSSDVLGLLRTSIFSVGIDVNRYIVRCLRRTIGTASFSVGHDEFYEGQFDSHCLMHAVHNAVGSDTELALSKRVFDSIRAGSHPGAQAAVFEGGLSGEVCKYHSGEKHKLLGRSVGFRERCRGGDKQLDSGG